MPLQLLQSKNAYIKNSRYNSVVYNSHAPPTVKDLSLEGAEEETIGDHQRRGPHVPACLVFDNTDKASLGSCPRYALDTGDLNGQFPTATERKRPSLCQPCGHIILPIIVKVQAFESLYIPSVGCFKYLHQADLRQESYVPQNVASLGFRPCAD